MQRAPWVYLLVSTASVSQCFCVALDPREFMLVLLTTFPPAFPCCQVFNSRLRGWVGEEGGQGSGESEQQCSGSKFWSLVKGVALAGTVHVLYLPQLLDPPTSFHIHNWLSKFCMLYLINSIILGNVCRHHWLKSYWLWGKQQSER